METTGRERRSVCGRFLELSGQWAKHIFVWVIIAKIIEIQLKKNYIFYSILLWEKTPDLRVCEIYIMVDNRKL